MLINAFFDSQFSHCPMIWMFHNRSINTIINNLYYIQHYAWFIRMIPHLLIKGLLIKNGSVTVHQQNLQSLATELFKIANEIAGTIMENILSKNEYIGIENVCVRTCMHACMHACVCLCVHVHKCECAQVCVYVHVCSCVCVCAHACLSLCISVCVYVFGGGGGGGGMVRLCVFVCACICLYMQVCACVHMRGVGCVCHIYFHYDFALT